MFNILITGANGQLGCEIRDISTQYPFTFFFTCKDQVDITDHTTIESFVHNHNINVIINCAAYTAVDKAEKDYENANKINHYAVKNLAIIAKKYKIKLIHISTDYVFDGTNYQPYHEKYLTNPLSIYGKTKCDGEQAFQDINPENSIIIRTSWLYSSHGTNFVKTMLRLGREKASLNVVFDQIGTPTYAKDLAYAILEILPKLTNINVEIYHYSNEGVLSWFDFAKEIMKMKNFQCKINPIETIMYPTPAKRPYYSLLNKAKIKQAFNLEIPFWKDSLIKCLETLNV